MMCDNAFAEELQKNGYDLTYKKLTEIYKQSRLSSEVVKRREHNKRENEILHRMDMEIAQSRLEQTIKKKKV
jgi:hypothetical protein